MKIRKGNLLFNIQEQDKGFLKTLDVKKINKIFDFYGLKKKAIKVNFVYSIDEYVKLSGMKFELWHCGLAVKDRVFVFSPSVIEKVGVHKKKK